MDASGKVVLQPKYSLVGRCNEGLCPVAIGDNALNNKWGLVEQGNTLGYVNPKGTWVWKGSK